MSSRREESRSRDDDRQSSASSADDTSASSPDATTRRGRERSSRSQRRSGSRSRKGDKFKKKTKNKSSESERGRGKKEDRGKSRDSWSDAGDKSVSSTSSRSREERRRERSHHGRKKRNGKEDRSEGRKKDRRRDEGRSKKTSRKRRRSRHSESDDDDHDDDDVDQRKASNDGGFQQRNQQVVGSILRLLSLHPALATDLPVMLVRLAGGATFNLSQMTDVGARTGLEQVFATLEPFGVVKTADTLTGATQWTWKPPDNGSAGRSHGHGHDLLLIRIVRSLCNEMGLTMQAVHAFEAKRLKAPASGSHSAEAPQGNDGGDERKSGSALASVERCVSKVLQDFEPAKLAGELAVVVEMLQRGECVSLEGVNDPSLRGRLEVLLAECGLRRQAMMKSDAGSESVKDQSKRNRASQQLTGYAIPDVGRSAEAMCRAKLGVVLQMCHDTTAALGGKGASLSDDVEEEDGPAPRTAAASARKGPALPPDVVKAQAARRALELECAKAGVAPPVSDGREGQREEWMLVPGKFDFLGSVQAVRGRTFESKRGAGGGGGDAKSQASLDPAVEAEIRQIMQAHEQARGPSLMEIHQQKKKEEAEKAAGSAKGSTAWKWNRDKDLDFGRSVDKNALDRIYGNASTDLKSKFQGGFG